MQTLIKMVISLLEYWVNYNNLSGDQVPVGRDTGFITMQAVGDDLRIVRYPYYNPYSHWKQIWYTVRSGSTVTCFVDGKAVMSATDSTSNYRTS